MVTANTVLDSDAYFTLDTDTGKLINNSTKKTVVQGSHNSERLTFEFPRYIDGHDMSECNIAQVHFSNIKSRSALTSADVYECGDLAVTGDGVTFSWLISKKATMYAGALNFSCVLKTVDDDGNLLYSYPTATFTRMTVVGSTENGESTAEEYADILESWKANALSELDEILAEATSQAESAQESAEAAQQFLADMETRFAAMEATVNEVKASADNGDFDGAPGITPHIGENGNWFLGDTDTGVKAQGLDGTPGDDYVLTADDKTEIANQVLAALPIYAGEVV